MKLLLLLALILPLRVFGQQQLKVTVELTTGDCRKNEPVRVGFDDVVRFYRDGKLYKQVVPMSYNRWPIQIKDFDSGTYKVTYRNIYNQLATKVITVPATSQFKLALCPDQLEKYPQNSLATLRNGQTVKVSFYSQGCFHSEKESLSLTKKDGDLFATLSYGDKNHTIKLTTPQIEAFKRFENELAVIENGGYCTTTDLYTFTDSTKNVKKVDSECAWEGFVFLRSALFGEIK